MLSGHRSAWRRRRSSSRAARIAVPLAIPMALGLTLGIIIAVSGNRTTPITQSALGDCVTASASPAAAASSGPAAAASSGPAAAASSGPAAAASSGPAAAASGSAAPCPSASASASGSAPAATAVNVNCDIIVPANPLSARGLATPYQLTGPAGTSAAASGCTMANAANLGAYVQATILNPRTGALSVYNPLVITQGTTPAVAPVVPKLPRNAIVTIDFGFNGTDLIQVGATPGALREGRCVDGLGSVFGQVSFCNGIRFFNAAFALMREGRLRVPSTGRSASMVATAGAIGTATMCPVTRNFDMVDQDPSDNVTTKYLFDPGTGQTAQDNAADTAAMPGAQTLVNGSDNALLDNFLDPAFGCTPFMAPDLGNNGTPTTSQALDELLATRNQPRTAALVPENDEMVLDANGQLDPAKTDLYRAEIGQAPVDFQTNRTSSPAMFCQNMVNIQTPFLAANQNLLSQGPTPVPAVGENLFTFMANRLNMSFTNLGCQNFGLTNPVTVVLDGDGAAMSATFNTTPQQASNTTGPGGNMGGGGGGGGTQLGNPLPAQPPGRQTSWRKGRHGHHLMDPSGA